MSSSPAPPAREIPAATSSVISFDGTEIVFDVRDAPSRSTILIIPGFWRDRQHPAMRTLASSLAADGYRTAVADCRGHGDSGGTYGFNYNEHYDIDAVARALLARSGTEAITLIGFSYGGAIAISTAARHELPIASLLLISPVADFAMLAPRINPFTVHRHIAFSQALKRPRFEWRIRRSAKLRAIDDIGAVHAPVCFIHVKNDWLVNHRHSVELYEHAHEPKELHLLDVAGNYHADRIFSVAAGSVEPVMMRFLDRYTAR